MKRYSLFTAPFGTQGASIPADQILNFVDGTMISAIEWCCEVYGFYAGQTTDEHDRRPVRCVVIDTGTSAILDPNTDRLNKHAREYLTGAQA